MGERKRQRERARDKERGSFTTHVVKITPFRIMDTLGFEPRAFRMRSGCDTTTPCAHLLTLGRRSAAILKPNWHILMVLGTFSGNSVLGAFLLGMEGVSDAHAGYARQYAVDMVWEGANLGGISLEGPFPISLRRSALQQRTLV